MYKNILLMIIITFFVGCGSPNPDEKPQWFTNLPQDTNNYYATASASTTADAQKLAIDKLRAKLNYKLDESFEDKKLELSLNTKLELEQILDANANRCDDISMENIQVLNNAGFKNKKLILVSISKKAIFNFISKKSNKNFQQAKKEFSKIENLIAIKRFIVVENIMKSYPILASDAQLKSITSATYSTRKEFRFLNKLKKEYEGLKSNINIYLLSDNNSKTLLKTVKTKLQKYGLKLDAKVKTKDTIKILISSKTTNYGYNKTKMIKNLTRITSYNIDKKQISAVEHITKEVSQTKIKESQLAKIKELGIFNFLGL